MENNNFFPKGFRFKSELDKFKCSVDYVKQLIKEKKILFLYGCIKDINVKLLISEEEFIKQFDKVTWEEFNDILQSEILIIVQQNYEMPLEKEVGLREYLQNEQLNEEQIDEVIKLKLEKRKYVYEKLYSEQEKGRYILKKKTISEKLADVKYNVSRTVDEIENVTYANIKIETNSVLLGAEVPTQMRGLINPQKSQEVSFICDKYDIEYLISELQTIQKML